MYDEFNKSSNRSSTYGKRCLVVVSLAESIEAIYCNNAPWVIAKSASTIQVTIDVLLESGETFSGSGVVAVSWIAIGPE